ncbi:MAG TPA: D-alanyl-D-alanine carboxypeptidase/D-alanyl-D-alanine-endopeptidase [Gemmatimonadaceae bacterium]|nr:D-alanyl-D-alanine carboxypeptidase/D-alanyl-D-alanine-endopeptidase [Gemmatimonadaceae bacterium]
MTPLPRTLSHAAARRGPARRLRLALALLLVAVTTAPPATSDAQRSRTRTARRAAARPPRPPGPTTPRSREALAADLATMIGQSTRSGTWGVMVLSLTRGDTLYALNAGEPMQPASTMKLMTSALALRRLGPDHRFRTTVYRTGPLLADGTVQGDLVLRGAGDPAFSGRYLSGGPEAPVDLLAHVVAGAGVRHVTGSIVGDPTAFETRLVPAGWKETYLHLAYAAPVSALSINENVAWITVAPQGAGAAARVTFEPATTGVPIVNRVRTRAGRGSSIVVINRPEGGFEVRGWIGTRAAPRRVQMVIPDPAPSVTGAFREALRRAGVTVDGGVRLGPTPDGAEPVGALPSPPLSHLLAAMNRESINHYAELIFRNAARGPSGTEVGSAEHGDAVLRAFLTREVGVTSNAVVATDGSGLSVLDRVTPRAMAKLLAYAHEAPWSDAFHASLPVAGESELLRLRMRASPAQGNLHAKTGTTDEVIALAGYTTAENGEILAFAFLYNGTDRWRARDAIDRMGETLSGFARD